ncbi:MAG: sigma-70 family RNA polymerase sigma factor [Myxococcota bacterium]|nr:sigma-70 family RNA polymerase sigma factor [Myxococcota bacterium]
MEQLKLLPGNSAAHPVVRPSSARKRKSIVDERRIIARLKERDEKAFTELVQLHKSKIFSLCFRMLNNRAEAEDIAQDTFVRAFLAINSFRGDSQLGTWLYRIALNLCKNRIKYHARRKRGHHRALDGVDASERSIERQADLWGSGPMSERSPQPDEILEGRRAQSRVALALSQVEPAFRTLLVLRDVQGLPYDEIKSITRLPIGTVKSRLHRARHALKRAYDALGDEVA